MTILYNKSKELTKRIILRKKQTPEETKLWEKLRRGNLGVKFKRQYSVGAYVLDFYSPIHKLAVELDGSQHFTKDGKEYDKERTECLEVLKIRVLRFKNNEVNDNIDTVINKIISELNSFPSH